MSDVLIISDAPILASQDKKVAYAPYVKEMDIWLELADQVTFISPTIYHKRLLTAPFKNQDFKVIAVKAFYLSSLSFILSSIFYLPQAVFRLWAAMRKAHHIHLRAPGNLALLAGVLYILLSWLSNKQSLKHVTVKYAGNWDPDASQPFSYKLQRKLFKSRWFKHAHIMAYGEWDKQPPQVKPFFTATYSEKDKGDFTKTWKTPYQFIYVGTLSENKNPQLLVELVTQLNSQGIPAQAHFYGDGSLMEELKSQAANSKLRASYSKTSTTQKLFSPLGKCPQDNGAKNALFYFYGNQPAAVVKQAYQNAHFSFLASKSEGWPKAIAEAMWHGCIPIATPVSCVPWMLGITQRQNQDQKQKQKQNQEQKQDQNQVLNADSYDSSSSNSREPLSSSSSSSFSSSTSSSTTSVSSSDSREPVSNLGSRGILYENLEETIKTLKVIIGDKKKLDQLSKNANEWSQQYTIEKFTTAIAQLINFNQGNDLNS